MITIGSLFSGIGGYELGVMQALRDKGIPCRLEWQVEKDGYCRKVLARHWPNAIRYEDINTFLNQQPTPVDVLLGGFPCQDLSIAGNMEGINGKRSGLFFTLWHTARYLGCKYVLLENVPAVSIWGGAVLNEISRSGYDAEWATFSAQSVGAPHLRRRWWAICVANGNNRHDHHEEEALRPGRDTPNLGSVSGSNVAHPCREGLQGTQQPKRPHPKRWQEPNGLAAERGKVLWPRKTGESQPRVGGVSHGVPPRLDRHQWPAGRGDLPLPHEPSRVRERRAGDVAKLTALGNAIVPQCAYVVGLRLAEKIPQGL